MALICRENPPAEWRILLLRGSCTRIGWRWGKGWAGADEERVQDKAEQGKYRGGAGLRRGNGMRGARAGAGQAKRFWTVYSRSVDSNL
jgi:hypothetical protein